MAVVDYAGNAAYYQVTVSEPYEGPTATLYGTTGNHSSAEWRRFASNANYDYETVLTTEMSIFGAAYGDGYLFFTADRQVGYEQKAYLYVVDYPSFENPIAIGAISASPYYERPIPYLAYNTKDGELYYVKQGGLYAVDVADASEVQVATLETDLELSGMVYSSQEQCFYIMGARFAYDQGQFAAPTGLYRFVLPEQRGGEVQLEQVADFGIWLYQTRAPRMRIASYGLNRLRLRSIPATWMYLSRVASPLWQRLAPGACRTSRWFGVRPIRRLLRWTRPAKLRAFPKAPL